MTALRSISPDLPTELPRPRGSAETELDPFEPTTARDGTGLSTTDLRELGAVVEDVLCVVDRAEGGVENLAGHRLSLTALFTVSELKAAVAP
jgi:hypothetical protein